MSISLIVARLRRFNWRVKIDYKNKPFAWLASRFT